jgi:hypothetical protein
MDISWTFSGDGLLAFAGGALALLGVWWSNHQSVKNLQKQLEAERKARTEETERQKKAVATALLFEIDGFYATYLRRPRDLLIEKEAAQDALPQFASIGPDQFPIYRGNASKVGELPTECVRALVGFFQRAESIVSSLVDYASSLDRAREVESREASQPSNIRSGSPFYKTLAGMQLATIQKVLPETIKGAHRVCSILCPLAGVPFKWPPITVAQEKLSPDEIEATALEENCETSLRPADAKKN